MSPLEYSKARLFAVLEEVRRLKESDFPYIHSRAALEAIEVFYTEHLQILESLAADKDTAIVNTLCGETLYDIFAYLGLLGFILRSTNVRNAFEVHGPILSLARLILGEDIKLILSSEWEFSPLTFPEVLPLPNFVLIGLPAPEAENPLLLPLAGHELGHSIWRSKQFDQSYYDIAEEHVFEELITKREEYIQLHPADGVTMEDSIDSLTSNIAVKRTLAPVVEWTLRQLEEYFCDCVGFFLFDAAFLHAYAYLLSPKAACPRSVQYPNTAARISNLVSAAAVFREGSPELYTVPSDFPDMFEDDDEPTDKEARFLVEIADGAATRVCPDLIRLSAQLLREAGVPTLEPTRKALILEESRQVVPACKANSLTNIINAAWEVFHDATFWPEEKDSRKRQKILQEVVLKSIELLEIEAIYH